MLRHTSNSPVIQDSLKKRYFYKLLNNVVSLPISLVTQAIIPRGLGPKMYGDFNFLNNFFMQIVSFLDMGTSSCFYTKLSQKPKEPGLVSFYLYFSGVVSLVVMGFVFFISFSTVRTKIWPDQAMFYIYLAAGLGVFTWITEIFNKMADAYGITVRTEMAKILQRVFAMTLILFLFIFGRLNLTNFFYYQYLILLFLVIASILIMEKAHYSFRRIWELSTGQIKGYLKEFYRYTHPLFVYSLVGLVAEILDRWFLQKFSGSIQQGFFGLSNQIGAICFLFSGAMTPLIMREFSVAYNNKDLNLMTELFRKNIPLLYSITAFLACFVAVNADKVTLFVGGGKFKDATIAVAIMAFYPIHRTYGQLSSSVFYATGQTRLYRNIGVVFMLLGLPITYFLIAPKTQLGLDAGATGLAIKMILIQFILVNTHLFYNAKLLKLSYWWYLWHQIFNVGCLIAIAAAATFFVGKLSGGIILRFMLAGVLYTLLVALLVYYLPFTFGIKKDNLQNMINIIYKKFQFKK